jgi:KipI family sensor histidine kinase inhibitor
VVAKQFPTGQTGWWLVTELLVATSPRLVAVGDHGILVKFDGGIDIVLNRKVIALACSLRQNAPRGVGPIIPTYNALLVHYDSAFVSHNSVCEWIAGLWNDTRQVATRHRRWQIPVCYGGDFGIDLTAVAEIKGLLETEVVALHCAVQYHVYMVGFAPGLAYLGPLSEQLHIPRRRTPRVNTPAGSVNIGGEQALIASIPGPSGWHLLGRTPAKSFDPVRSQPFLFEPGDEVCFKAITPAEFHRLDAHACRNGWMPEWEWSK